MCGIAGFISNREFNKEVYIIETVKSINHRGPDDYGYYNSEDVLILNTRLSIIDVENGNQPFINENESIIVVQNGEIYNYIEVREKLKNEGCVFNTESDTEVILKAYERYKTKCFELFNGMFAIAIYDKEKGELILGRDRLGVKPLYIYRNNDEIFFSSEIKSFLHVDSFKKTLNNQSIHNYLKYTLVT